MIEKEFNDMKLRTFVLLFLGIGLFFMIAPLYKFALEMLSEYTQIPNMPKFLERFLPKGFVEKLSEWSFYIYTQWFGKNLGQFVPIFAMIMGFPIFAREIENGTIEFLLARSSRKKVFASKVLTVNLVVSFQMITFVILPALYSLFASKNLDYTYLPAYLIHTLVGALFWLAVTVLFSVMFDDQVKPILSVIGVLASTTVIGVFKPLRFMSTYPYILGSKIVSSGRMDVPYTLVLICLSITLTLLSYTIFLKKEF